MRKKSFYATIFLYASVLQMALFVLLQHKNRWPGNRTACLNPRRTVFPPAQSFPAAAETVLFTNGSSMSTLIQNLAFLIRGDLFPSIALPTIPAIRHVPASRALFLP